MVNNSQWRNVGRRGRVTGLITFPTYRTRILVFGPIQIIIVFRTFFALFSYPDFDENYVQSKPFDIL